MTAILELDHVSKSFFALQRPVVEDLSLSVEPGEFVTLLGPSGCGKTTTLRIMAGFEAADAGRVLIAGEDVTEKPAFKRSQINTMFQEYALFPHMTVAENVGYGLRVAGVSRHEVARYVAGALELVGLPDRAAMQPHQLSGGQRQRVALARALVRKPKVLLLDEPLSALDVKLRDAMQVELRNLHRQLGITFVMVTHDQKEALVMSDRVAVMRAGKIVQIGAPQILYDQPTSPYVADFVGAANIVSARLISLNGTGAEVGIGGQSLIGTLCGFSRPTVGQQVTLAIRPEQIRLVAADQKPADKSSLSAEIESRLFHGSLHRLDAKISGTAQRISVDLQRVETGDIATLAADSKTLRLSIEPKAALIFAQDDR
jgi:spermidine/putrescine ABC transporter ATP-binding subunit